MEISEKEAKLKIEMLREVRLKLDSIERVIESVMNMNEEETIKALAFTYIQPLLDGWLKLYNKYLEETEKLLSTELSGL